MSDLTMLLTFTPMFKEIFPKREPQRQPKCPVGSRLF